jgi:hypothetical protein
VKKKLERPCGLVATVAAAAPQKATAIQSRHLWHYGNSWSKRLTTQAESKQAAEVYLYCARVYEADTLVPAQTTAGVRGPISGALNIKSSTEPDPHIREVWPE